MFYSVLYPTEESASLPRRRKASAAFPDLQLDLILKRAMQEAQSPELEEAFYTPVSDPEVIAYRQAVFRELEEDPAKRKLLLAVVERFGDLQRTMEELQGKQEASGSTQAPGTALRSVGVYDFSNVLSAINLSKGENWLDMGRVLEKAGDFAQALGDFAGQVQALALRSEALRRFGEYVAEYCASPRFREMEAEAGRLREILPRLRYCLWLKNNNSAVKVLPYEEREDYASRIEALFSRFRQGETRDFRRALDETPVSEHLENQILQRVSRLYPKEFGALREFGEKYLRFEDDTVLRFAREVRFYFCWLDMLAPLKAAGLPFCYPEVHTAGPACRVEEGFDLALALRKPEGIVTNGFSLAPPEQVLVVTGPNQGGKSTFARAFGQAHYLASLGLPVPGRRASLPLCDMVYAHFEREEGPKDLDGRLRDDLRRLKTLLDAATPRSVLVINEIFSSTTAWDALVLSRRMLDRVTVLGGPCVVVTFLDELADYGPQTVSMAAEVSEDEGHARSFRILRRKPGGRSYAEVLAQRHGLSYEEIKRRVEA